jgi:hypothetical protein
VWGAFDAVGCGGAWMVEVRTCWRGADGRKRCDVMLAGMISRALGRVCKNALVETPHPSGTHEVSRDSRVAIGPRDTS